MIERGPMRRPVLLLGMLVLVVAVLRRFGRPLGERVMEKCQEMLDRGMPERRDPDGRPTEPTVALAGR
jgi:hypothetical protein